MTARGPGNPRLCGTAAQGCLFNVIQNGIQADGSFLGFARPSFRSCGITPGLAAAGTPYQLLNRLC